MEKGAARNNNFLKNTSELTSTGDFRNFYLAFLRKGGHCYKYTPTAWPGLSSSFQEHQRASLTKTEGAYNAVLLKSSFSLPTRLDPSRSDLLICTEAIPLTQRRACSRKALRRSLPVIKSFFSFS